MAKQNWQDIGNVKARRQARAAQLAKDAAWRAAHRTTTIQDGQTIQDIADLNDTRAEDILAANPEMRYPKTGMVINLPGGMQIGNGANQSNPYGLSNPAARVQAEYQPYLPSNANLGFRGDLGYAPRPVQSSPTNPYQRVQQGYPVQLPALQAVGNFFNNLVSTPGRNVQGGGNMSMIANPGRNVQGGYRSAATVQPPQPLTPPKAPGQQFNTFFDANPEVRQALQATYNKVMTSNNYQPEELAFLEAHGWIQKTPQALTSGGGGGNYKRKRKGGRGGGSGGGGATAPHAPAFSSGSSNMGLVNWRI